LDLKTTKKKKETLEHIAFLLSKPTKETYCFFYKFLLELMPKELVFKLLTKQDLFKEPKDVVVKIDEKECMELIKKDFGLVNMKGGTERSELENKVLGMYATLIDSDIDFSKVLFKYNIEGDFEGAKKCLEDELDRVKLF